MNKIYYTNQNSTICNLFKTNEDFRNRVKSLIPTIPVLTKFPKDYANGKSAKIEYEYHEGSVFKLYSIDVDVMGVFIITDALPLPYPRVENCANVMHPTHEYIIKAGELSQNYNLDEIFIKFIYLGGLDE